MGRIFLGRAIANAAFIAFPNVRLLLIDQSLNIEGEERMPKKVTGFRLR